MHNTSSCKGKYLHYKGKSYDVLGEARNVKTNEVYIVYKQNYGRKQWWIRPKDMFFETVLRDDQEYGRFEKIDDHVDIRAPKFDAFNVRHTETGERYFVTHMKFYDQYYLRLENMHGEQLQLELPSSANLALAEKAL